MATEHIINIVGDISDVEAKIKTVENMLSQLKKEFGEVGKRVSSSPAGRSTKSTTSGASRKSAQKEVSDTQKVDRAKRKQAATQGLINSLTEDEIKLLLRITDEFRKFDHTVSGSQRRIRSLANAASKDFTKLLDVFVNLNAQGKQLLLNQAITLNRTLPDVRNKINQTINAIAKYRDVLRSVGRVRAAEAIDLSSIESSLANKQLHELNDIISRVRLNTTRLANQMKETPLNSFQQRLAKITQWMGAVWTLFGAIAAAQVAIRTISEIEKAVIDLRKVMDEATTDFGKMREEIFNLGKAFGQLPSEVAKAMFLFARQGKQQNEVLDLTRTALMAVNIAELSAEDAVELLTAAVNQLNLEASESIVLLDSWNEVSNRNAVSTKDLGDAFRFTASLAQSLGLDIHELNALITILTQNTGKSGSEIGRTLRFAFTRAFTPTVLNALSAVGISITDTQGNMRDFSSVLREISERWDEFSDATRQNVAFAFGGTRHVNDMRILFERLSEDGIRIATESMNSFGSAARENLQYMQSLERRFQSMIASVQELVVAVGDSGLLSVMKAGVDVLKGMVDIFNSIPAPLRMVILSFGLAKVAGFGLSTVMGKLGISITGSAKIVSSMTSRITTMSLNLTSLMAIVGGLRGAFVKLFGVISTFLGPWGKVAGAVLLAATAYNKFAETVELADERTKTRIANLAELQNTEANTLRQLEDIRDRIIELNNSSLSDNELTQQKTALYQKFNSILPGVVSNYQELENAINKVIDRQSQHLDLIERASEKTIRGFVVAQGRSAEQLLNQAERQQKALNDIVNRFYTDRFFPPQDVIDALEMSGFLNHFEAIRDRIMILFKNPADVLTLIQQRLGEAQAQIDATIADANRRLQEARQLTRQAGDPFALEATEATTDVFQERINRLGEYLVAVQDFLAGEQDFANELSSFFESVDRDLEGTEQLLENMEKLFDNTGKGLREYVKSVSFLNRELDKQLERNERIARTILQGLPDDVLGPREIIPGTEEYFQLLRKINEIEEHFNQKAEEQREILNKAWDAGILRAEEYLIQLRKIEESRAFEKQREQVREIMEELRSGTSNAFTGFISDSLKGEEKALERFQDALKNARLDALAEGISSIITSSGHFQTQIARQQNALAQLFGGSPEDFMPLQEKEFEIQKKTEENTAQINKGIDALRQEIKDLGIPPSFPFGSEGLLGLLGLMANEIKRVVDAYRHHLPDNIFEKVGESLENLTNKAKEFASGLAEKAKELAQKLGGAKDSISEITTSLNSLTVPNLSESLKIPDGLTWENNGVVSLPQPDLSWEKSAVPPPAPPLEWEKQTIPLPSMNPLVDAFNQFGNLLDSVSRTIKDNAISSVMSFANALIEFQASLVSSASDVRARTPAPTGIAGFRQAEGQIYAQQNVTQTQSGVSFAQASALKREQEKKEQQIQDALRQVGTNPANMLLHGFIPFKVEGEASAKERFLRALETMVSPEALQLASRNALIAGAAFALAPSVASGAALLEILKAASQFGVRVAPAFDKGGFTGPGDKNKPVGVVHAGEYVIPKWMVEKYPEAVAAFEQIRKRGFQEGGFTLRTSLSRHPLSPIPDVPGSIRAGTTVFDTEMLKLADRIAETTKPLEEFGKVVNKAIGPMEQWVNMVENDLTGGIAQRQAQIAAKSSQESGVPPEIAAIIGKSVGASTQFALNSIPLVGTALSVFAAAKFAKKWFDMFTQNSLKDLFGFEPLALMGGFGLTKLLGFASGGFTGQGRQDEVAGVVHKGEYVIPKWLVEKNPELIKMIEKRRLRGFQDGGGASLVMGGSSEFKLQLSNETMNVLKQIEQNTREFKLGSDLPFEEPFRLGSNLPNIQPKERPSVMEFANSEGFKTLQDMADAIAKQLNLSASQSALLNTENIQQIIGRPPTPVELYQIATGIQKVIPTNDEIVDGIQVLSDKLTQILLAAEQSDAGLTKELAKFSDFGDIESWGQIFRDPNKMRDIFSAAMMEAGREGSTQSSIFMAAVGEAIAGTQIPSKSGLNKILKQIPFLNDNISDVVTGFGQLLSGFEQNIAKPGSGIANVLTGLVSMTGIGGAFTPFLAPIFQSLFGGTTEKANEAEKITNVRRFIATDDGLGMPERFFLSGRHANLLAGGRAFDGGTQVNINEGAIVVQGVESPRETAMEVVRQIKTEIPKQYNRQIRRGLSR